MKKLWLVCTLSLLMSCNSEQGPKDQKKTGHVKVDSNIPNN